MKKKCAFTICAKNYIGLAQILEMSLKKYNDDISFYIFVADEFERNIDLPQNVIIAKDVVAIDSNLWTELSFKYDLTEFCTCIKPYCFKYLLENTLHDYFCYFDPDILIFNSLDYIYDQLIHNDIFLTPHILEIQAKDNGEKTEDAIRYAGMFNLGFLGLRRGFNMVSLLEWWKERLNDYCFVDSVKNQFTDQKWMDFIPIYFSSTEYYVSRHKGVNLAPWNFYEREVFEKDGILWVKSRQNNLGKVDKLLFVHYSGYSYQDLLENKIVQKNILNLPNYKDLNPILMIYAKWLRENKAVFDGYINQKYTYAVFKNGIKIDSFHRRLYHSLVLSNIRIGNPFETHKGSFYYKLIKRKIFARDEDVNKYNKNSYPRVSLRLKQVNFLMNILFRIIGYKRYILLLKLFRPYSRVEAHAFLLDKKYIENIWL